MNFWKNLSTRRKEVFFFLSMVLFGVLKEFLVYNLPIMAVPKGIHDDWIMVHMADALRGGRWLGEYNDLTLTKACFPLLSGSAEFSAPVLPKRVGISVYGQLHDFRVRAETSSEKIPGLPDPVSGASVESGVLFGSGVSESVPQQYFLYPGAADLRRPAGFVAA